LLKIVLLLYSYNNKSANQESLAKAEEKSAYTFGLKGASLRRVIHSQQADALIAWAKSVEITIEPLPSSLFRLKLETKHFFETTGVGFRMSDNAIVAHIRHGKTNYHKLLSHLRNSMPGATTAYLIIRHRANVLIQRRIHQHYQREISGADHE
jgi:hypothetical protein